MAILLLFAATKAGPFLILHVLKKLLLFDIDGTLVDSGGGGLQALQLSLAEHFGIDDDLRYLTLAGATDTQIARDMLDQNQLPHTPENITRLIDGYLFHLHRLLPERSGRVLPGIFALLDSLRTRPHVVLALLTGNMARGAEIKLSHFGLWHYFEFGAYADDHHLRNELGHFARTRAVEKHGIHFPAEAIYVIGDTPRDIACGRAVGATTVAVATGSFSTAELAAHQPDFLFADFTATEAALDQLGW